MKNFFLMTFLMLAGMSASSMISSTLVLSPYMVIPETSVPAIEMAILTEEEPAPPAPVVPCQPANTSARMVGGIDAANVPLIPGAARLTYEEGQSQYTVRESGTAILGYYTTALPSNCWQLQSISATETIWQQEAQTLRIALADSNLGAKTVVTFAGGPTQVLGLKLAQTEGEQPPARSQPGQPSMPPQPGQSMPPQGPGQFPPGDFDPNRQPMQPQPRMMNPDGTTPENGMMGSGEPGEMKQDGRQRRPMMKNMRQPGEEGNMDQMGPEGQEGMDEETQKRMDEERFRQMKKGLQQFEKGIKQMQSMIKRMSAKLTKAGVGIPPELTAAMERAPEVISQIKEAKTAEDLDTMMDDVQDVGETLREWGPKLGQLTRLVDMLGRSNKDVANMKKKIAALEKGVKKNPATEMMVAELKVQYDTMTAALTEAKALAATDAEAALEKIETEVYDSMEEFWNAVAEVDMMQNLTKGIAQAKSEITRATTRIRTLERSKKAEAEDITELKEMVVTMKESLAEVQTLAKDKTTDVETLRAAAEELWGKMEEFEDKMNELGQSMYDPGIKAGQGYNFELPQGFDFRSSDNLGSGNMMGDDAVQIAPKF